MEFIAALIVLTGSKDRPKRSKCCNYERKRFRCRFADSDSDSNEFLRSVALATQYKLSYIWIFDVISEKIGGNGVETCLSRVIISKFQKNLFQGNLKVIVKFSLLLWVFDYEIEIHWRWRLYHETCLLESMVIYHYLRKINPLQLKCTVKFMGFIRILGFAWDLWDWCDSRHFWD